MKKGFTIIETLVAITILMIAISGPLTVSFKALNAAVSARDQMIASFMAQDAVEYARNIKDNNISTGASEGWLATIGECTPDKMCAVDSFTNSITPACTSFTDEKCRLQRWSTGRYGYAKNASSTPSTFYRTMYTKIEPNRVQLVVDVIWQTGSYGIASTTFREDLYEIIK